MPRIGQTTPTTTPLMPFWQTTDGTTVRLYSGDVVSVLQRMQASSVHTVITSPPYWGLRDYGTAQCVGGNPNCEHDWGRTASSKVVDLGPRNNNGDAFRNSSRYVEQGKLSSMTCLRGCGARRIDQQIGSEPSPDCGTQGKAQCGGCFICTMVKVFRAVKRVLRSDGTLWLNMGCGYLPDGNLDTTHWKTALALVADGWILRSDIPWVKRCLSGGTVVYAQTQKGEMPTTLKDLVRLDPKTVKLWDGEKWNQVKGFYKTIPIRSEKRGTGEIQGYYELELRNGETINCTAEHEWPTENRGLIRTDDLRVGDVLRRCKLPEPQTPRKPECLEDDLIGWFVGLYIAEGNLSGDRTICIHGHKKENTERLQMVRKLADLYDGNMSCRDRDGNGSIITLSGPVLIGIIKQYVSGETSHNKRLTTRSWQRSNRFLYHVLTGYLEGDGHLAGDERWRLGFCNNPGLVVDLRTVCARLGVRCRIKRCAVSAYKDGPLHKGYRGEIRLAGHKPNQPAGGFPITSDTEITAIRASRSRLYWDVELEEDPHLFALASGVLSHNSCMPESCTNRPAKALEYVFLFSKQEGYYFDMEAIKSNAKGLAGNRKSFRGGGDYTNNNAYDGNVRNGNKFKGNDGLSHDRNFRQTDLWFQSVSDPWGFVGSGDELVGLDVTSQGYEGAHYACFPPKLITPMIKAATSEKGCCAKCGCPWVRLTKPDSKTAEAQAKARNGEDWYARAWDNSDKQSRDKTGTKNENGYKSRYETVGWQPSCTCNGRIIKQKVKVGEEEVEKWVYVPRIPLEDHEVVPCTVLDPFIGSGTTCAVSIELGRNSIGIDLNEKYLTNNAIVRVKGSLLSRPMMAHLAGVKRVNVLDRKNGR